MQILVKWLWSFTRTAEGKHIHRDAYEDAMQAAWDAKDLCGNCSFKRAIKSTSWGRAGRPRKSRKDWKGRREATGRPAFWGRVSKEGKEKVEIEKEPRQYKGWPVWQLHQEQRKRGCSCPSDDEALNSSGSSRANKQIVEEGQRLGKQNPQHPLRDVSCQSQPDWVLVNGKVSLRPHSGIRNMLLFLKEPGWFFFQLSPVQCLWIPKVRSNKILTSNLSYHQWKL